MFDVGVVFVAVDDATVPVVVVDVVFMGFSAAVLSVSIFHRYFPFGERESNLGGCYGRLGFKKHFQN